MAEQQQTTPYSLRAASERRPVRHHDELDSSDDLIIEDPRPSRRNNTSSPAQEVDGDDSGYATGGGEEDWDADFGEEGQEEEEYGVRDSGGESKEKIKRTPPTHANDAFSGLEAVAALAAQASSSSSSSTTTGRQPRPGIRRQQSADPPDDEDHNYDEHAVRQQKKQAASAAAKVKKRQLKQESLSSEPAEKKPKVEAGAKNKSKGGKKGKGKAVRELVTSDEEEEEILTKSEAKRLEKERELDERKFVVNVSMLPAPAATPSRRRPRGQPAPEKPCNIPLGSFTLTRKTDWLDFLALRFAVKGIKTRFSSATDARLDEIQYSFPRGKAFLISDEGELEAQQETFSTKTSREICATISFSPLLRSAQPQQQQQPSSEQQQDEYVEQDKKPLTLNEKQALHRKTLTRRFPKGNCSDCGGAKRCIVDDEGSHHDLTDRALTVWCGIMADDEDPNTASPPFDHSGFAQLVSPPFHSTSLNLPKITSSNDSTFSRVADQPGSFYGYPDTGTALSTKHNLPSAYQGSSAASSSNAPPSAATVGLASSSSSSSDTTQHNPPPFDYAEVFVTPSEEVPAWPLSRFCMKYGLEDMEEGLKALGLDLASPSAMEQVESVDAQDWKEVGGFSPMQRGKLKFGLKQYALARRKMQEVMEA